MKNGTRGGDHQEPKGVNSLDAAAVVRKRVTIDDEAFMLLVDAVIFAVVFA